MLKKKSFSQREVVQETEALQQFGAVGSGKAFAVLWESPSLPSRKMKSVPQLGSGPSAASWREENL